MGLLRRLFGPNVSKLADSGDVDGLVAVVESEAGTDLRVAAVQALTTFDDDRVRLALVAGLDDPDTAVSKAAEAALETHGEAAAGVLAEALGGESGLRARKMLVDLGESAVDPLREACADADESGRTLALSGLRELDAKLGTAEVRETLFRTLLASLGDRSPTRRCFAASALAELRDRRAARALAAQLKDGQEEVRDACCRALVELGEPAVLHVVDALADRNPNSRRLAAGLLGELCAEGVDTAIRSEVLRALLRRVDESDQETRDAVVRTLGRVPVDDVIAARLDELADPEGYSPDEALTLLRGMLTHGALGAGQRAATVDRMRALGFEV